MIRPWKHLICLVLGACLALGASSALAHCPNHATSPAPTDPGQDPPTGPDDCRYDGDTSYPPGSDGGMTPSGPEGASCSAPPYPNECPTQQGSPDSLPTIGERVRLHVTAGGGALPMRWGRTICFGDNFRLNYLSYLQLTSDHRYARLYDPAGQAVHNFVTDTNAPSTVTEVTELDGDTVVIHSYRECYVGSKRPGMNRVSIKTYTKAGDPHPYQAEVVYPEGGSLQYEFDSFDPMVGDLAGPLFRIAKRVTREGHAVTFSYSDEAVRIRDASDNEYTCHLNPDREIVRITIISGEESRSWSYACSAGKIVETNEQTGYHMEMRGTNYVTSLYLRAPDGKTQTATYTRDARGNLTASNLRGDARKYTVTTLSGGIAKHVETRDGNTVTREFDANGMTAYETSSGHREVFQRNAARRLTYYLDALGHEWCYDYSRPDEAGVLLRQTAPDGGETRYEYLPGSTLMTAMHTKIDDDTWHTATFAYDANGRLVEETRQLDDESASVTRYVRNPDGTIRFQLDQVDAHEWCATYFEYNRSGQITRVKGPYWIDDPSHPENNLPEDGSVYEYDPWGNRIASTDPMGFTTRYEYDDGNRLVAVIDPLGNRTEYMYDGWGQRTRMIDALGYETVWTYDAAGRITSIAGSGGDQCGGCAMAAGATGDAGTYTWSSSGLLTAFKDPDNKTTKYQYDAARRLVATTDPLGNVTRYAYDAVGNLVGITDPMESETRYEYDAARRRIAQIDPLDHRTEYAYNLAGRLVRVAAADGGERRYGYNRVGWLIQDRIRVDATAWREARYGYNLRGELVHSHTGFGTPEGVVTHFVVDAAGRRIRTIVDPDGLSIVEEAVYDPAGRLVREIDGNGAATTHEYDAAGNLIATTTPEGRRTKYENDAVGRRLESLADPDGCSQGRYFVYDAAGRLVEESDGVTSRSFDYDRKGRNTKLRVPGRSDAVMVYDAADRLIETRRLNANGSIATTVTMEYDKAGRLIRQTDEMKNVSISEYDAKGRRIRTVDPTGVELRFDYDPLDRRTKVVYPHGGEETIAYSLVGEVIERAGGPDGTVRYRYDALGRLIETVDANGMVSTTRYDKAGRIVREENPLGQGVSFTYDNAGRRTSLTDANGNTTRFIYDRDGNLISLVYPAVDGQPENVEHYAYDGAGRMVCKTTPNGTMLRFRHDPAGNVEAVYHGEALAATQPIPDDRLIMAVDRDGAGVVTAERDRHTVMAYQFDLFGRLVEARDEGLAMAVRYGYDRRDLRTAMEVVDYSRSGNGETLMAVAYTYDAAGRLASVQKDGDPATIYQYHPAKGQRQISLPNGVTNWYGYDEANRLVEVTAMRGDQVLARYRSTVDPAGNRTGLAYQDGSHSSYTFDQAYRLTGEKRTGPDGEMLYQETYRYDAVGNRLTKQRTGWEPVVMEYTYNARNQLVATSDGVRYEYDANGNLVLAHAPSGREEYTYDILDRLVRYTGPAGNEETVYRGTSWRRREQTVNSQTAAFLYDDDDIVAELPGGTREAARFYVTPELDRHLSVTDVSSGTAETLYYTQDTLAGVRLLTDAAGAVRGRTDYTAFGEAYGAAAVPVPLQRYGYHGGEWQGSGGGVAFRYRSLNPRIGRFLTRDPLSYAGSVHGNLYDFVFANPTTRRDPYGLQPLDVAACQEKLDGMRPGLAQLWSIFAGDDDGGQANNKQCQFPNITCCPNCRGSATAQYNDRGNGGQGEIQICRNSFRFSQIAHELLHHAQAKCPNLGYPYQNTANNPPLPGLPPSVPKDRCEDRICKEIQAYAFQKLLEGKTIPFSKEVVDSIKNGARMSAYHLCLKNTKRIDDTIERIFHVCAYSWGRPKTPDDMDHDIIYGPGNKKLSKP